MSVNGYSGMLLRVGAREEGRDDHGCPLRGEITHDRVVQKKVEGSQRGRYENNAISNNTNTHN